MADQVVTVVITVQIADEAAAALEELVRVGRFATREDAVRSALAEFVERDRRRRIGDEIVEGYRRLPQSDGDVLAATAAAIVSIHEEPWRCAVADC